MSHWFYNKDLKPQGPLTFEEMKKKILRGEIAPRDLVMKEDEGHWLPALEWKDFNRDLFPAFQNQWFKVSSSQEKEWILLASKDQAPVQLGPFSIEDLRERLASGEISASAYVWRSGLSGWVQIQDRQEFFEKPISPNL